MSNNEEIDVAWRRRIAGELAEYLRALTPAGWRDALAGQPVWEQPRVCITRQPPAEGPLAAVIMGGCVQICALDSGGHWAHVAYVFYPTRDEMRQEDDHAGDH